LIYYDLFKPGKMEGSPNDPKFSATLAFLPADDCAALKAAARAKAKEKWGDKVPANIRWPFRKQSEKEKPGFLSDGLFISPSSKMDRKPELVEVKGGRTVPITDESTLYRGCWAMATVRPYAYDNSGNKGVGFGLVNLVKICDDLPLASGSIKAADSFADLAEDVSISAGEDTDYSELM
jgi:hypothetical protein